MNYQPKSTKRIKPPLKLLTRGPHLTGREGGGSPDLPRPRTVRGPARPRLVQGRAWGRPWAHAAAAGAAAAPGGARWRRCSGSGGTRRPRKRAARGSGRSSDPGARGGAAQARARAARGGTGGGKRRRTAAGRVPDDGSAQTQRGRGRGDGVRYEEAHCDLQSD